MLKTIIINYKRMMKQNLFSVLVFECVFLSLFYYIGYIYLDNQNIKPLFTSFPTDSYYVSYSPTDHDKFDFPTFIKNIKETSVHDKIGYSLVNHTNTITGGDITSIYINEYLRNYRYSLNSGRWFGKTDTNNVIIGGNLCKQYDLGDKITINTEKGKTISVNVIGKLPNDYRFMLYTASGKDLSYNNITTKNIGDVVVTINEDLLPSKGTSMNAMAIVMDKSSLNFLNILELPRSQITSFQSIHDNSKKHDQLWINSNVVTVLLLIIMFICIVYEVYIYIQRNFNTLIILYELGINNYKISTILLFPQIINSLLGLIIIVIFQLVVRYQTKDAILFSASTILFCLAGFMTVAYGVLYGIIDYNNTKRKDTQDDV